MNNWFYSILSVLIVSSMSLVAVIFLSWREEQIRKILLFLVSFAVGALLGDAMIHLLPESFETMGFGLMTSLWILIGVLLFFILEKFIHWRHCHDIECAGHPHSPLVAMNLIGDGVHNFVDGVLIAASFSAGVPLGISTTIAVLLHEIPQEVGDFGVLVHGGLSTKKALLYNFLSGLSAVAGALFFIILGTAIQGLTNAIIPITAGGFIYIAGSDLIPELKHETRPSRSAFQLISMIMGITVMAALTMVE
jgi:zinc and cadmium transporter